MVETIATAIWNPTFKKSGFQMFPDFRWSDFRSPLYLNSNTQWSCFWDITIKWTKNTQIGNKIKINPSVRYSKVKCPVIERCSKSEQFVNYVTHVPFKFQICTGLVQYIFGSHCTILFGRHKWCTTQRVGLHSTLCLNLFLFNLFLDFANSKAASLFLFSLDLLAVLGLALIVGAGLVLGSLFLKTGGDSASVSLF